METKIYSIQNNKLVSNGPTKGVCRTPNIILFSYDAQTREQIIKLFDLNDATIEVTATYDVTIAGKAERADYFTYYIFENIKELESNENYKVIENIQEIQESYTKRDL